MSGQCRINIVLKLVHKYFMRICANVNPLGRCCVGKPIETVSRFACSKPDMAQYTCVKARPKWVADGMLLARWLGSFFYMWQYEAHAIEISTICLYCWKKWTCNFVTLMSRHWRFTKNHVTIYGQNRIFDCIAEIKSWSNIEAMIKAFDTVGRYGLWHVRHLEFWFWLCTIILL